MKKKILFLLSMLCLSILFTGCQNTKDKKTEDDNKTEGDKSGNETESIDIGNENEEEVNYEEYVTLGEYKGIEYTALSTEVTDEDLKQAIKDYLNDYPDRTEIKDQAVKEGDIANIDFAGKIDGEAFEGGSGSTDLKIGSNQFIPGFEDGLIGVMPGDTVDLNLKFPDNYAPEGQDGSELNGKAVVFTVTVHSIIEEKEPEYNEEFVKNNTKFNTIEEFEADLLEKLKEEKATEAEDAKIDEIFSQLIENCPVEEVPQFEYDKYYNDVISLYEELAQQSEMELSEMLNNYYNTDEEGLKEYAASYAESMGIQATIFQAIAKAENLTVSDEEYEAELQEYYEANSDYYENREDLEKRAGVLFRDSLLYQKVMDFVVDNAVATAQS